MSRSSVPRTGLKRAGLCRTRTPKSFRYQPITRCSVLWELSQIKATYSLNTKKSIMIQRTLSNFWRKFRSFIRARRCAYFGTMPAFTLDKKPPITSFVSKRSKRWKTCHISQSWTGSKSSGVAGNNNLEKDWWHLNCKKGGPNSNLKISLRKSKPKPTHNWSPKLLTEVGGRYLRTKSKKTRLNRFKIIHLSDIISFHIKLLNCKIKIHFLFIFFTEGKFWNQLFILSVAVLQRYHYITIVTLKLRSALLWIGLLLTTLKLC